MEAHTHVGGNDDVRTIIDLAVGSVEVQELNADATLIGVAVPRDARFQVEDLRGYLDKYKDAPDRVHGTVRVQKVEDLIRYVDRFDDEGHTTIWLDATTALVVAVLNDHAKDAPQWGDHRVSLQLEHTPEWNHWLKYDGHLLSQVDFATHLEEGVDEIIEPDGATMLEIAQSMIGSVDASFRSAHRLRDGSVKFAYVEEVQAGAGQDGELDIPKTFTLSVAPFVGEEPAPIVARFRFRIVDQKLKLAYNLERPWQVEREAVDRVAVKLAESFQGDRVFIGSPRS